MLQLKKTFPYSYLLSLVLITVLVSCSVEKNTLVNRSFHNLTAHYNVYFNGKEAMKAGLLKIETQLEEDYTKILPIFKESLPNSEEMVMTDMTTAIEKGEKLIKFHSITKPPKSKIKSRGRNKTAVKSEYNRWVDDAYIMMGRGYLYKKEHTMAIATFQLIIRKYKDDPVRFQAYLWLIRSMSESERYTEATQLVQLLENDKSFPEELEGELAIVTADLHLKQQHFDEAIHQLNIGIKKIKGNKRKSRYSFILAQLYQETGKKEQALAAYRQVIRRRPEYPLLFNARIRSAEVFSGQGDVSVLRNELNKMRKKKWNEPYLDQIYYALGNISYNEGKVDEAIELYKKSSAVSKNNIHQKALSSLTLGDIYLDRKNYIPSGDYYDSAMVIIDESYPNYESIAKKYATLGKLVKNLKTIETEDSLQLLAKLPAAELDKKIAEWVEAEKKRQELDEQGGADGGDMSAYYRSNSSRMRLNSGGSGFYFYNTSTVSYGKKEFTKLWGERKNEDNWRRRNKSEVMLDDSGEPIEDDLAEGIEEGDDRADDPTTPEYYKQDIPLTDSMMQQSHTKISDALFNSGTLLKNDFSDFNKSVGSFTGLNTRYPENGYLLTSWFNLWDLYKILENPDSSAYYKNLIVTNYPESNYARYLVNPNFFVEEAARIDNINKLYASAFNAFKQNDFTNAGPISRKVIEMKPDSSIASKAQFIRTIAESKDLHKYVFADSLRTYVARYPGAPTVILAEKILSFIQEDKFTNYEQMVATGYLSDVIKNSELLAKNIQSGEVDASKWDNDNELLHYFIIAFPAQDQIDINRLKFDLANYNLDHFTTLDFEIETENLNQETMLVIVRNFDDKESAMVYFMSIIRKPEVFKTLAGKPYLNFIASNNNYRQMLNDRAYEEYIAYFVKNYSTLTAGNFSDKELESPEALMARLKDDPNSNPKEEGEFVMVETTDSTYVAVKKEQLFNPDYNTSHSIMILINQKNASTGYLMRDLIKYNSATHRDKRLRVVPGKMSDFTLLSVASFANAYDANEYMKLLRDKKELFTSLGEIKYETFIISDENQKKLIETGNIDEWNKFYQINYIRRTPQAPKTAVVKTTEEKPVVVTPDVKTEEPVVAVVPEVKEEAAQPAVSTDSVAVLPVETNEAEGLYTFAPETGHNLIYLLPLKSPNQSLLTTYLTRLNAASFRSDGLTISTEQLNEVMMMVVVKGLQNKEKAIAYYTAAKSDQRVSMSLKNVTYKSYLISNDNLQKLKTSNDIARYQQFHDKNY
jgi:tetratricopeptide (TPR) repeat protein